MVLVTSPPSPDDALVGPRLIKIATARAPPVDDLLLAEQDALQLMQALHHEYMEEQFQVEIQQLKLKAGDNEVKFIMALGPLAARAQAPVFSRFGMPAGQKSVLIMKTAVKRIAQHSKVVKDLAGDLRELLSLPREEQDVQAELLKAQEQYKQMVVSISKAPLDVRGPFAEAMDLPYKATPEAIATAVPKINSKAKALADHHLAKGVSEVVGEGKMLGADMATLSKEELRKVLTDMFDRYLRKMLSRVVTPVSSFTQDPEKWRCAWADNLIEEQHVRQLWGECDATYCTGTDSWQSLGIGVTVIDNVMDAGLLQRARAELDELELQSQLTASKDPCNVGARSVWLHFETNEERGKIPSALQEICDLLAGLPAALMGTAAKAESPAISAPSLRLHPHVMAATYKHGAEYHVHKDSYDGTDNQRMVSVLLYLNSDWAPGDQGELRVYSTVSQQNGRKECDQTRFFDIAPHNGRIVMFRSREVWHAVREPREQRWALTLWVMAD